MQRRRYRRQFAAVLAIYLAVVTYRRLSPEDRERVVEWIREYIDGPYGTAITYLEFELYFQTSSKAAFWAVAMKALDIPPTLAGESWPIPNLRHWWNRLWAVDRLLLSYQTQSPVTGDVERYLLNRGLDAASFSMRSGTDEDRRQRPR